MRKLQAAATDNPDRDRPEAEREAPSLRVERFIVARAEGTEFAVPAGAVAAIDIATEERWADLGADARGVLWEGRYLFVETIPGGEGADVRGRGEFAFLVVRTRLGLSALVIDRLLGEVLAVREPSPPPWDGQVRAEGSVYPVLPIAPPEEELNASGPAGETNGSAVREDDTGARDHGAAASGPGAPAEAARAAAPAKAGKRNAEPKRGKTLKPAKRRAAPEPEPEEELEPEEEPEHGSALEPAPRRAAEPIGPRLPQPAPRQGDASRAGRRRRAVVVDPRIGWRRGLAKRIRERGFEVREATRAGEFRGPAGIAFIGDLQTGVSPEAVAETLQALGWRAVLVAAQRPAEAGPFEAALVWPVRDEDLDSVLSMIGGDEDAGRENRSNPGGGRGPA